MKIVVCIKQTFDTEARISVTEDGQIDDSSVLFIINPYDEYAVEEAIRIKEQYGGEVTVITVGGNNAQKSLQHCLAMGADQALLVDDTRLKGADGHVFALVLARILNTMDYNLILCGRESVDVAASEVQTRLAEILDLPQVNVVSSLKVLDARKAEVTRDIEGGKEFVELDLPAVISVQKGINEIRYPSLRLIMKASKRPIETFSLKDLDLTPEEITPYSHIGEFRFPTPRQEGRLVSGDTLQIVSELIDYLRYEVRILKEEE